MKHDALGRRPRDTRVSTGKRISIQPRDLVWFEMLHRHGALPFRYLHEFTTHIASYEKRAVDRATDLFHENETAHGGAYLERPYQQFATLDARYQNMVYDISPKAEDALRETGKWRDAAPHTSNSHWRHDFMLSCVTASIHLATIGTNYRFIFQDEILERAGTSLSFSVPYTLDRKRHEHPLHPDRIFGIQYPDGKARLFIVEADCSTEPMRSRNRRKTVERCAHQYREFIGRGLYKDALKVSGGLLVIHLTTSEPRMRNMMDVVQEVSGGANSYSLFGYLPQFSRFFKPPQVLRNLFTDPWERVGEPPFSMLDT